MTYAPTRPMRELFGLRNFILSEMTLRIRLCDAEHILIFDAAWMGRSAQRTMTKRVLGDAFAAGQIVSVELHELAMEIAQTVFW